MKKILLVILFLTSLQSSLSQNRLVGNVNNTAKILQHVLINNDTNLYLNSAYEILSMKIIGASGTTVVDCMSQNLYVHPLKDLDAGNNVIMVFVNDKIIVFNIIIEDIIEDPIIIEVEPPIVKENNNYNITSKNRIGIQSRDEYRKNNLRPNGKPYN